MQKKVLQPNHKSVIIIGSLMCSLIVKKESKGATCDIEGSKLVYHVCGQLIINGNTTLRLTTITLFHRDRMPIQERVPSLLDPEVCWVPCSSTFREGSSVIFAMG